MQGQQIEYRLCRYLLAIALRKLKTWASASSILAARSRASGIRNFLSLPRPLDLKDVPESILTPNWLSAIRQNARPLETINHLT